MSLATLLNRPVRIVRRSAGGEDEYGDDTYVETIVETVGELQQRQRTEPLAEGELSSTEWLLVLPAGTDIDTSDRVLVDNQFFEVVGEPWPARNPRTQTESHVEATVKRTATEGGS
jgi:hypothetical protein